MTTITTNLSNKATAQLSTSYNSMADFDGVYLGANETGLYRICSGGDFNGTEIDASFTVATTDLGISNSKRMWCAYIGYESEDDLTMEVWCDEISAGTYTIPASKTGQQRAKVPINRGPHGRYWKFKFSNTNGCDFAIDEVEVVPVVLNHGHGNYS